MFESKGMAASSCRAGQTRSRLPGWMGGGGGWIEEGDGMGLSLLLLD